MNVQSSRLQALDHTAAEVRRPASSFVKGTGGAQEPLLAEAARRSARAMRADPPKPKPTPVKPPKKKRVPTSGDREVRPFTFEVVEKGRR